MTTEQQAIVELPPSARVLVTAGPGTGKTHLLLGRLAQLIGTHGLSPGQEIAVLTFSRAAVREIRHRATASEDDTRYVRAITFDAFATRLLSEFNPEGSWSHSGYEGRIKAATALIRHDPHAQERIRALAHVCVDEVQDLVGARAEFVKAILETAAGGFTLLGDPAQGIYNFQLQGAARIEGSAALYKWLRKRFSAQLDERTLTINHRAETENARVALWAGVLLNADQPDYDAINERLETVLLQLRTLGRLESAGAAVKRCTARTAILCRTNGQALMISRKLHEDGLPHVLQRSATDRVLPAWVGILLGRSESGQIGRRAFEARAAASGADFDPAMAWSLLRRAEGGHGQSLDIARVAERIRRGDVPDDLFEEQRGDLVVSTIHRAKGLEFDTVILAMPSGPFARGEEDEIPEETRLLYVALSRPKRRLCHLELPGFKGVYEHKAVDRWVRFFGCKAKDFELRGDDTHREDPAGGFLLSGCDPRETQEYLAGSVRRGDPVLLKLLKASENGGAPRAFYQVEHGDRTIGLTSEAFGDALFKALKISASWEVRWPAQIDSLHIEAVDTVAGSEASGRRWGLGSNGIWLRSRVSGFGALNFTKPE